MNIVEKTSLSLQKLGKVVLIIRNNSPFRTRLEALDWIWLDLVDLVGFNGNWYLVGADCSWLDLLTFVGSWLD